MNTVLIIFLLITGGACLVLSFIQIRQKYKAYKASHTETVDTLKTSQIELYRQFAEECLLDSGFDLENVFIAPNTRGGVIFRYRTKTNQLHFNCKQLKEERYHHLSNQFEFDKIYMILPEISNLNNVWTWLHEIGHYMCQHLGDKRPDFIHEYEAERYAETIIKQCPVTEGPSYFPQYTQNVHNIYLEECINNAKAYIKTFIDKLSNDDVYALSIYMEKHIDEYVNTTVEIPMIR